VKNMCSQHSYDHGGKKIKRLCRNQKWLVASVNWVKRPYSWTCAWNRRSARQNVPRTFLSVISTSSMLFGQLGTQQGRSDRQSDGHRDDRAVDRESTNDSTESRGLNKNKSDVPMDGLI
jgi:hypothetical protein